MSDFSAKNQRGLMEAYASMYQFSQPVIEEQVDQEVFSEDMEIDNDLLVDGIINHLVIEGYVKDENQALNIIPHISDAWLDNIIENIIINEHFIECVNSFIEEGYDLSSYTWEELYEEYASHLVQQLNEVAALAPALGTPAGAAAAIGGLAIGALGKMKQAADYLRTSKQWGYGDPASKRWLETGSYAAKTGDAKSRRDDAAARRQQAAERLRQRQQAQPSQPRVTGTTTSAQPSSGTSAGGTPPAGPTPPKPPKGPKLDPLQTVKDLWRGTKEFIGKGKGPASQVLGKPARERFFGTTRTGQITRGATVAGVSALDIGGKIADPSKPSLVAKLGSPGPGAIGTVLQGIGNIPGIRGTSMGTGARGTGQAFRQVGREMRDQPGTTSQQSSGSQGRQPIFKNGQITGWK